MRTRRTYPIQLRKPILESLMGDVPLPFRWDVTQEERLGALLPGPETCPCPGFMANLLACGARIIAFAGDSDLVFVGRSLESMHDLLSGLLWDTSWRDRLNLLQFSVGYTQEAVIRRRCPEALGAFRIYLDSLGLSPAKLIIRERPVALVDVLNSGRTFHQLLLLLHEWAIEEKADWPAMQRKIRVVGVVRQLEPSPVPKWKKRPKPWCWRDDADWIDELLERGALAEVVLDREVWSYLADFQVKTTPSYSPEYWGKDEAATPCRTDTYLKALRLARNLHEKGLATRHRARFSALLATQPGMRQDWFRNLLLEIRS